MRCGEGGVMGVATEERAVKPGDIAVVPGGVEHEAFFPEDTEMIDFFAPGA
jgi:hypothetical protein